MALGRVALERSETLDKFAGVWVDSEKTEEYIMRIAGGWAFGVEGASDEKGGVCELSLEQRSPSSSAGVGVRQLVLKTLEGEQKGWTLNDDASSSVRMVWKRAGTPPKPDSIWQRRGGYPATPGESSGAEAPRGGRVVLRDQIARYSEKVAGTWHGRDVKFLKLAPAFRVIEGSPSLTVVKCPEWPAEGEENVTLFKLDAGKMFWFTERAQKTIDSADGKASHEVFFYKLADGRGWVHDYVKNAPAIRRLEVILC